ncbi:MAG: ribosome recycling factor [Bryobacterales bacterium]|nr:ribosome recycling factor [Bryobacterales bacterium]
MTNPFNAPRIAFMPLLGLLVSLAAPATAQTLPQMVLSADTQMDAIVLKLKDDFIAIRTNRVTSSVFSRITVNYYGAMTPVPNLASIAFPEPRLAILTPYDKSMLAPIASAITASLGVSAGNDGNVIRVVFPELSTIQRQEMIKTVRAKGDEAKIAIRNVRRKTRDQMAQAGASGAATETEVRAAQTQVDTLTNKYTARVDEMVAQKEAELLQ